MTRRFFGPGASVKDTEHVMTYPERVAGYLEANRDKLVRSDELYTAVWRVPPYPGYKNVLRTTVTASRHLLEEGEKILSVRSAGYIFVKE
jgi:DNA-binding SARP family transcriptional activator